MHIYHKSRYRARKKYYEKEENKEKKRIYMREYDRKKRDKTHEVNKNDFLNAVMMFLVTRLDICVTMKCKPWRPRTWPLLCDFTKLILMRLSIEQ